MLTLFSLLCFKPHDFSFSDTGKAGKLNTIQEKGKKKHISDYQKETQRVQIKRERKVYFTRQKIKFISRERTINSSSDWKRSNLHASFFSINRLKHKQL